MPAKEYWRGEADLVIGYRRADEMRKQRKNEELWMQGMYFYEALCDAAPLFRAFAKKGTKAHPFAKEPYPLKGKRTEKKKESEREQYFRKRDKMEAMFMAVNQTMKKRKEVRENAHHD